MAVVDAVVWDIGRVLVQWDFPLIWRDVIPDPVARAAFTTTVVSESWHSRHDVGETMAALIAERVAEHPAERALIERYRTHWLLAVPGPIAGTHPRRTAGYGRGATICAYQFRRRCICDVPPDIPRARSHDRDRRVG